MQCRRPRFNSQVGKICWRRNRLPTPVFLVFPCGSADKESTCNVGDRLRSLGWEDHLEKGKATHASILAWRIWPGLQRVRTEPLSLWKRIQKVLPYYTFFFFFDSFFFFFFSFIFISWRLMTILQWFLSYIDMNQSWIYMYSPSRSPLPLPYYTFNFSFKLPKSKKDYFQIGIPKT